MEKQLKRRGPKLKPASEKKVSVKIWVKAKHEKEAQKRINYIAEEINARP
jgi:hypothetical protein